MRENKCNLRKKNLGAKQMGQLLKAHTILAEDPYQFPAPISDSSQLPKTSAPGKSHALGLPGTPTHMCM